MNDVEKQDYRRWQYGGSFGGPIVKNKMHYFGAFERTQQDTFQVGEHAGVVPEEDGIFALPYRETLFTVKGTANFDADNYLSVRYGRNQNSQPYGATPLTPPSGWGDSSNTFNSINVNYNMVLGAAKLNEFIFQYADFKNASPLSTICGKRSRMASSIGQNPNTPQATEQQKWQFRDDFSWHIPGKGGIGHGLKAGVNWIHEPRLFITFDTARACRSTRTSTTR